MNKIWMIAVVVCAALMVACGGEKKDNKETPKMPVVAQAAIYATAFNEAVGDNIWDNDEAWMKLMEEMDNYAKTLSEGEVEQFNYVCTKLFSPMANEAIEAIAAQ